jgi:hypothetical protein
MLIYSRRFVWTVALAAVCIWPRLSGAQPAPTANRWSFHGKSGTTEIELRESTQDDGTRVRSLGIWSDDGSKRLASEEAGFIASVLDDLANRGIQAKDISFIQLRANEPDVVAAVAPFAARSQRWRSAMKAQDTPQIYALVVEYLNNSRAFYAWRDVLRQRGARLKVEGVEKVIYEPYFSAGVGCPPSADCHDLEVPADALVQMNIYPNP